MKFILIKLPIIYYWNRLHINLIVLLSNFKIYLLMKILYIDLIIELLIFIDRKYNNYKLILVIINLLMIIGIL